MSAPIHSARLRGLLALSAIAITGAHTNAVADDARERETVLKKVSVQAQEESALNLTRSSTAGSRLGLTSLQTPASVDVISSQTIRARGQNTVAQAVTQNGIGITINSSPIFGSAYTTRGFSDTNSIMQLYDGTRLYLGIGNVTFPFDTWNVDSIEVLHGPASVLYGEGAIGGVVNVISKKPATDAIHNEIQVSAGSYDSYGLALDSTGPLNDVLSYRVSGSGRESEGWVDLGENSSKTFSGALRWQAADDLAMTLTTDYGDQQPMAYFGTPLIDGHLDKSLRDENYNVKNHRIQFKDAWNQLKTEWTPNENLELRNTVYLLHSRREWRNVEVYSWNGSQIDRSEFIHIIQSQNQLGDRLDATLKSRLFGGDNALVVGLDVNSVDFSYTNNFYPGGAFAVDDSVDPKHFDHGYFAATGPNKAYSSTVKQRSLFAEDRLAWSEQWSAIAGIRYDHIEIERDDIRAPANDLEKTFDTISWRLGGVFNPTPTTALYAQYSTAVDPVTTLLTLTPSDEQFDLTTGRQFEVGFKQSFLDGRGEWTASAFKIVKKKLLVTNPVNPSITDQIGRQSSRGIELALSMDLGAGWHVDTNATWIRAKFEKFTSQYFDLSIPAAPIGDFAGEVPPNVPEHTANLWLAWDFLPGWTARAGAQYVGKAYQVNSETYSYENDLSRDAYTVAHASLEWQPTGNTTLALQAHNLFDRVYAETWHGNSQWFLGQPRTIEAVARYKF